MPEKRNKQLQQIEESCDQAACLPCVYPNCQRYVRTKKIMKKVVAK